MPSNIRRSRGKLHSHCAERCPRVPVVPDVLQDAFGDLVAETTGAEKAICNRIVQLTELDVAHVRDRNPEHLMDMPVSVRAPVGLLLQEPVQVDLDDLPLEVFVGSLKGVRLEVTILPDVLDKVPQLGGMTISRVPADRLAPQVATPIPNLHAGLVAPRREVLHHGAKVRQVGIPTRHRRVFETDWLGGVKAAEVLCLDLRLRLALPQDVASTGVHPSSSLLVVLLAGLPTAPLVALGPLLRIVDDNFVFLPDALRRRGGFLFPGPRLLLHGLPLLLPSGPLGPGKMLVRRPGVRSRLLNIRLLLGRLGKMPPGVLVGEHVLLRHGI